MKLQKAGVAVSVTFRSSFGA